MTDPRPFGPGYLLTEMIDGSVWRGQRRDPPGDVAIKLVSLSSSAPAVEARLAADRAALSRVRHPNLVPVLDLVSDGTAAGVVMELVAGPTLKAALKQGLSMTAAQSAGFGAYLCAGLAALHSLGLVHQDMSPDKVIITTGDGGRSVPRITGFAPARLSDGPDRACSIRNEPSRDYVAPEVLSAKSRGPEVDVYAVGCILYELLSGRAPFSGGSLVEVLRRHAEEPVTPLPVSAPLWSTVASMLEKDPSRRPSARDAALALAGLSDGGSADIEVPQSPIPTDRPAGAAPGFGAAPAFGAAPGATEPPPPVNRAEATVALPMALRQQAAPEPERTVVRQRIVVPSAEPAAPEHPHGIGQRLRSLFRRKDSGS